MFEKTVWERQQELNNDPAYQEIMRKKKEAAHKRDAEIKEIERDFVASWEQKGLGIINGTGDVMQFKKVIPEQAAFLLEWIPKLDNRHGSRERAVRGLAIAVRPFDGGVLMECFDDPLSSFHLKWAIGSVIAQAEVLNVEKWLKKKFKALTLGKELEMLIYALPKYLDIQVAMPMLYDLLDKFPLHVADVLGRIGGMDQLQFLDSRMKEFKGVQKTAIAKAIKKIKNRIKKLEL